MHPDTDWLDYPVDDDTPTPPPPSTEQAAHARRLRERRAALEERRLAAALEGGVSTPLLPHPAAPAQTLSCHQQQR